MTLKQPARDGAAAVVGCRGPRFGVSGTCLNACLNASLNAWRKRLVGHDLRVLDRLTDQRLEELEQIDGLRHKVIRRRLVVLNSNVVLQRRGVTLHIPHRVCFDVRFGACV